MSAGAAGRSFLQIAPPSVAVEFAADRVTVVSLEQTAGEAVVGAHATEPLPPGIIVPSLNAPNVVQPNAAGDALRRAMDRAGIRGGRAALVVPDAVGRVSIFPFESIPASEEDLGQLVRWQARKSVPFDIDAAQVSWSRGTSRGDGADFIVVVARRDLIEEYEALCGRCGLQPGIVDLATFSLVNALMASEGGRESGRRFQAPEAGAQDPGPDWMLVHITASDATIAIVRRGDMIFFRNRPVAPDETLEDSVHQTTMYHEDRLGGGRFARVIVAGLGASSVDARRTIEARVGVPTETLDVRAVAAFRDRIAAGPELLDSLAAPVGVLRREAVA